MAKEYPCVKKRSKYSVVFRKQLIGEPIPRVDPSLPPDEYAVALRREEAKYIEIIEKYNRTGTMAYLQDKWWEHWKKYAGFQQTDEEMDWDTPKPDALVERDEEDKDAVAVSLETWYYLKQIYPSPDHREYYF